MELLPFERDAILAGLRLLQIELDRGYLDIPTHIEGVLTDDFTHPPISTEEIDVLCEKVNQ